MSKFSSASWVPGILLLWCRLWIRTDAGKVRVAHLATIVAAISRYRPLLSISICFFKHDLIRGLLYRHWLERFVHFIPCIPTLFHYTLAHFDAWFHTDLYVLVNPFDFKRLSIRVVSLQHWQKVWIHIVIEHHRCGRFQERLAICVKALCLDCRFISLKLIAFGAS